MYTCVVIKVYIRTNKAYILLYIIYYSMYIYIHNRYTPVFGIRLRVALMRYDVRYIE